MRHPIHNGKMCFAEDPRDAKESIATLNDLSAKYDESHECAESEIPMLELRRLSRIL